jgi:hypothetical protein
MRGEAEFDRDAVLTSMVLAICFAGAAIDVIYKIFG